MTAANGDKPTTGPLDGLAWWARFSEPRQRLWAEIEITGAKLRADSKCSERERLLAAADYAQRRGCKDASWALILTERRLAAADFSYKRRTVVATSLRD